MDLENEKLKSAGHGWRESQVFAAVNAMANR